MKPMSDRSVAAGMKFVAQVLRPSTNSRILSWSAAFDNGVHHCKKPRPTKRGWTPLLGKVPSMAILLRVFQSAHAMAAKRNMLRGLGILHLVGTQDKHQSSQVFGRPGHPKAPLMPVQINLECHYTKRKCDQPFPAFDKGNTSDSLANPYVLA